MLLSADVGCARSIMLPFVRRSGVRWLAAAGGRHASVGGSARSVALASASWLQGNSTVKPACVQHLGGHQHPTVAVRPLSSTSSTSSTDVSPAALVLKCEHPRRGSADREPAWVSDNAAVLPDGEEEAVNDVLERLNRGFNVESAVVTLSSLGDVTASGSAAPDAEAVGTALFNLWGIGDPAVNSGVLVSYYCVDGCFGLLL